MESDSGITQESGIRWDLGKRVTLSVWPFTSHCAHDMVTVIETGMNGSTPKAVIDMLSLKNMAQAIKKPWRQNVWCLWPPVSGHQVSNVHPLTRPHREISPEWLCISAHTKPQHVQRHNKRYHTRIFIILNIPLLLHPQICKVKRQSTFQVWMLLCTNSLPFPMSWSWQ